MKIFLLTFLSGTLLSASAFASYDKNCADYLSLADAEGELGDFIPNWQAALGGINGVELSPLEAEAWSDLIRGFSMILTFDNGKKGVFHSDKKGQESLAARLQKNELVEVQFLPDSLTKLGSALRTVCEALQLEGCAAYGKYNGLIDPTRRPFTSRQEQVLKWVYFGSSPQPYMLGTFKEFHGERRVQAIAGYRETRTKTALGLIQAVFSPHDAEVIVTKVLHPLLDAAYERFSRQLAGVKTN